ncbi:MAG: PrsW family intramembrane metalloprotease [Planctomycetes bacterium]|nr:PrsW family intramembrane metalloprotease [Planctomycetota bacterium]
MLTIEQVALGALPGLMWLYGFWIKDRLEPEPHKRLVQVFLLGGLAALLIAYARPRLEWVLPDHPGVQCDLVDAFVVTALAEEIAKLAAFLLGGLWLRDCNEPMDGIVYAAAAALGFASIENAFFLASEGDARLIVVRGFTSTLAHVVFLAPAGFFLVRAKLAGGRWRGELAALAVVAAVLLHGSYDWILMHGQGMGRLALGGFMAATVALMCWLMRWSQRHSPFATRTGEV